MTTSSLFELTRGTWSHHLTLALPSTADGPLASPVFGNDGTPEGLYPWKVACIEMSPFEALDFLDRVDNFDREVRMGDSIRYLAVVAQFAQELRVRGRALPAVDESNYATRAQWKPVITAGDIGRLELLATAMPGLCRSVWKGDGSASSLLRDMVESLVDATMRQNVDPPRQYIAQWLEGLYGDELNASSAQFHHIADELNEWRAQAMQASSALRTCFRIIPPDNDEADDNPQAPWQLQLAMQSVHDPSLIVECDEIWKTRKFPEVETNPIEILLSDLGRASRVYPPLDALLEQAQPDFIELNVEEAADFLQLGASLLDGAGFGVFLPSWWGTKRARLTARLNAKSAKKPPQEATGILSKESLVNYDWKVAIGDDVMSQRELERLVKLKQPLVRLRGEWVSLNKTDLQAAIDIAKGNKGTRSMSTIEALRVGLGIEQPDIGIPVDDIDASGWLKELMGANDSNVAALVDPLEFNGALRPYQQRGLSWLDFHDRLGTGACLADDMGLGKTAQLIALLVHERSQNTVGPTLVICPMSLVGNWQRELARFAPKLTTYAHHGAKRATKAQFAKVCKESDVVITTYQLATRDQKLLAAVNWHRVVLDEAQNIKNPEATQTKAIRSLPAARRIAITGTPVENRLSELWSIMDFLNPSLLGTQSAFRKDFSKPIERDHNEDAAERLKRITGPFLLRRMKTDRSIITDLPEKLEIKTYCNLTREQATLYQAVVDDMLEQVASAEGIQRKGLVLSAMLKLKQICNHPAQFLSDGSPTPSRSGKLQRLEETIDEVIADGERVLVFTQFAEMGTMLHEHLRKHLGIDASWLHGGVSKRNRDEMVETFQSGNGPPVFLLSLKAGGTGLTLTAANHVVHFDRWWNPAVENQATDRAFRIGQHRNVQVRKFITVGTLEERIDQMIEMKQALADKIVGSGENWITELSTQALRELIELGSDAVGEG